ncbi:hypothetical protein AZE42_04515 [Rhizopogon vesiculosus]|uniref:Uncharacterized protein n=1 Tax=Rhizopogon vesiculosus TaxID=180088 RepID=A0A1J8QIC8_9AGAM|nr:hypothetical protein AZE42_04515 [Rhizopogon vesiculosus]
MRPLTLHVSALNDLEYSLYTSSLNDLAVSPDPATTHDDAHYEAMSVGIREVRAWIQGRYPILQPADIDRILKLFYPNMLHTDYLTGGQFFATLRLVLHAAAGKGVDRTLAFIQAYPSSEKVLNQSRPPSPSKRQVCSPPSHPDRSKQHTASSSSSPPDTNPFSRKSLESDRLQSLPSVLHQFDAPPVIPSRLPHKISHNPFLMRDKANGTNTGNKSPEKPKDGKLPPLPPRKPAPFVAPKRRISSAQPPLLLSAPVPSPFHAPHHDIKLSHVMTPLMKQSLEASKHGQNMKRVEEQLDRERVLQVLKTTSSGSSASSRTRSLSPTKQVHKGFGSHSSSSEDTYPAPPLPHRRRTSSQSSTSSLPSIDQVASATVNHQSSLVPTVFRPPLPNREPTTPDGSSPLPAPPTHPDRRPTSDTAESTTSTIPRVTRSKSMHHTSTSTPPLPPPRRKRPESVQLIPISNTNTNEMPSSSSHARTSSTSFQGQGLSRHVSLTRDRDRGRDWDRSRSATDASPMSMSHIQKTISNLQLKAQPRLDAARYKAEAGLSPRRGFVLHSRWVEEGERALMADTDAEGGQGDQGEDDGAHVDPYSEPPSTDDSEEDRERIQNLGVRRDSLKEADNLKWPAGEGWRPLKS